MDIWGIPSFGQKIVSVPNSLGMVRTADPLFGRHNSLVFIGGESSSVRTADPTNYDEYPIAGQS